MLPLYFPIYDVMVVTTKRGNGPISYQDVAHFVVIVNDVMNDSIQPVNHRKKSMRITLSLTLTITLTLLTLTVTVRVTLTLQTLILDTLVNKAPTYTSMRMYFSCD